MSLVMTRQKQCALFFFLHILRTIRLSLIDSILFQAIWLMPAGGREWNCVLSRALTNNLLTVWLSLADAWASMTLLLLFGRRRRRLCVVKDFDGVVALVIDPVDAALDPASLLGHHFLNRLWLRRVLGKPAEMICNQVPILASRTLSKDKGWTDE